MWRLWLCYRVILGQSINNRKHLIYYASRTLNEAQLNYTIIKNKFLTVVFALEKFCQYLLGSKTMIFTNHSALKYLMQKKDTKARLIHWIRLLQEFDLEIKDKNGVENVVADHLFRIPNAPVEMIPINESFPNEYILVMYEEPWYADIANYLATGKTPSSWSKLDKHRFFTQIRFFLGWTVSIQILPWPDH